MYEPTSSRARVLYTVARSFPSLSFRPIARRNEFTRSRSNRALVAGNDSIAMLNRPLDKAREEAAVGNLFILISVRHKRPKGKGKTVASKRACVLCQLQADPRVHG